eukprot:gene8257-5777_t
MIRKKVLGVGVNSATLLVQDADAGNALRVLRRVNVSDWTTEDTTSAMMLYERMKDASAHMPHVVTIHAVLLQNGFLNVVSGYCEGGDLTEYLQASNRSFSEPTLFRWLLLVAQALKELQTKVKSCFYGLALDHVLIEAYYNVEPPTPARLRVGLPVPPHSYFTLVAEKKRNNVPVAAQYPPEVIEKGTYHPQLSDVWHLGKTAEELLSLVKLPATACTSGAQRLLERMTAARPEDRPNVDQVITAMSVLAHLEASEAPLRPPGTIGSNSSTSLPSASEVAATRPRRRVTTADWTAAAKDADATTPIVERLSPGATAPAGETPPRPVSPRAAARCSPRRVPERGRSNSWHRGAMEKMEELERLNSSPKTGHGDSQGRHGMLSARGGLTDRDAPGHRSRRGGGGASAQRYIDAVMDLHINTGTTVPFQYNREERGKMDNNTRVISQMLGEEKRPAATAATPSRPAAASTAAGEGRTKTPRRPHPKGLGAPFSYPTKSGEMTKQPVNALLVFEDADEVRTKDIKKCIKKWQANTQEKEEKHEHYVVTGSDGVFIYTPIPHRRPPESPRDVVAQKKKNEKIPVSIAVPTGPPPPEPKPSNRANPAAATTTPRSHDAPQEKEAVTPASHTPLRAMNTPRPRELAPSAHEPPRGYADMSSGGAGSRLAAATPRRHGMQQSESAQLSKTPHAHHRHADHGEPAPQERTPHRPRAHRSQESAAVPNSPAVMEWVVDSIRSSIRSLVKDRTRYGEVMLEVAAFVRKSEAERLSPEENGRLVRRLQSKLQLQDEKSRDAAISLCSQLVALEGLGKLLRDTSQPSIPEMTLSKALFLI